MKKKAIFQYITCSILAFNFVGANIFENSLDAEAKAMYKLQNGKLIDAKTKKVVKGYKVYNSKLYYNGQLMKKYKIYHNKLYRNGVLYTGTYQAVQYNKGVRLTGIKNSKFYKGGVLFTGLYNSFQYDKGVKFTGIKNSKLYKNGQVASAYTLYNGDLYNKDGIKNTGYTLYEGKLYNGSKLNNGLIVYQNQLYNNDTFYNGTLVYGGKLYVNGTYIPDVEKPVLLVPDNIEDHYYVAKGEEFTLPVVTAKDAVDGNLTVETIIKDEAGKIIKNFNTEEVGEYTVTYSATDATGNSESMSLAISIFSEDGFEIIGIE